MAKFCRFILLKLVYSQLHVSFIQCLLFFSLYYSVVTSSMRMPVLFHSFGLCVFAECSRVVCSRTFACMSHYRLLFAVVTSARLARPLSAKTVLPASSHIYSRHSVKHTFHQDVRVLSASSGGHDTSLRRSSDWIQVLQQPQVRYDSNLS